MTDAGWTAGKDVKEIGWYWWRLHPHRMKVVEVVQDYEGGPLRSYVNGMWIYLEQSGAEWLGPLSPDDKAQGRVAAFKEVEQRFDSMFGATDRRIDSVRDYRVDKFYTWLAQAAQDE